MTWTKRSKNVKAGIAAVRAIAKLIAGQGLGLTSVYDVEEWRALFASDVEWSMGIIVGHKGIRSAELMASMAVLHYVHPDEAEKFIQQVVTGENLKQGYPALTLRNYFLTAPATRAGGNNPQLIVMSTMNAFKSYVERKPYMRNSTSAIGLTHFRNSLVDRKKVRATIKFWKDVGAPVQEPGSEP